MSLLPEDFDVHDVDFDALYQGGQILEGVDLPSIPWDIGTAQPVVIEAERAGRLHGAVLDVGCGLGDNAIYLAGQGHQVTGIDAAPSAIEQARQRAGQRGVDVEFAVADATSLAGFEARFASVLDGACYHCLDEDGRHAYATALHGVTRPDALLNLFCFPTTSTGLAATMGVSEEDLHTTWSKAGWDVTDLRLVRYHINTGGRELVAAFGFECEPVPNEATRLQVPIWAMQARRA
ncbi:MAG: class I SAM-dependent methyltransferase [Acidimicrobiia bacterium]